MRHSTGTGFPGFHVAASLGLGEALVSGDVTSDEWLFSRENFHIIRAVRGSKRFQYLSTGGGEAEGGGAAAAATTGVERVAVSDEQSKSFCLSLEKAREVAKLCRGEFLFVRLHCSSYSKANSQ